MADQEPGPVAEERDELGFGIGVEAELFESVGDPLEIGEPFDPEKIDVQTRSMTVDLLLKRIRHKAIDLDPEFQRRRGIWTDQRQSRLIESILLKIPLPTLYAAENKEGDWTIVDGIQRLTAISRFVDHAAIGDSRLVLQGLEYLGTSFDKKTYEELPLRYQLRLLEAELVVHVIRHGTPDAVKDNIFARINTGGLPLSRQELRHALIPGKARRLLKDWAALAEFKRATDDSVRDDRMTDRELVLRFLAFRMTPPARYRSADIDRFLSDAMHRLNQLSEVEIEHLEVEFREALDSAHTIFGKYAFRKIYKSQDARYPINKALFETITWNLAVLSGNDRLRLKERASDFVTKFIELMNDRDFDLSVSQGTGSIRKVRTRFARLEMAIGTLLQC